MIIQKIRRDACATAQDVVVVIDVIRAFTTAAFAFHSGADKMILVGPIEDALLLKQQDPSLELMGEINGRTAAGFQHSNSPIAAKETDFQGKTIVFRTSCGTQGVVNCSSAKHILASSFVVAEATLKRIKELQPKSVSFVVTGKEGEEDLALADYLEARLLYDEVDHTPYLERVRTSTHGTAILNQPNFLGCSKQDLAAAMMIDHFNFALQVEKENNQYVMRPRFYD